MFSLHPISESTVTKIVKKKMRGSTNLFNLENYSDYPLSHSFRENHFFPLQTNFTLQVLNGGVEGYSGTY